MTESSCDDRLVIARSVGHARPAAAQDGKRRTVGAKSVLIVEDDSALSSLVATVLVGAGYRAITISDHAEIDEAVDRWQPSCVILDGEVRSTGESRTWDDAAAIRRMHPSLPVVIFTADGASLAEVRAGRSGRSLAAGFAGVISKPFVVEEFLSTVKTALERPLPQEPPAPAADSAASSMSVFPDVRRLAPDWPETDLFTTIVHELRGPLTVIRGQVQLARRRIGPDGEAQRDALDKTIAQVDRMSGLISELLDQARLASNSLSLNVVPADLVAAVAEVVSVHDFAEPPRITFRRPLDPITVRVDPERLRQILDNLIGNALKYSDGPVVVSLMLRGDDAEFRVIDHGPGIPENEVSRLFTPFFRTSRTQHIRGTGLGLHISRRLAERHGGALRLETSARSGSTFVLTLPTIRST